MLKRFFAIMLFVSFVLSLQAQDVTFVINISSLEDAQGTKLYMYPNVAGAAYKAVEFKNSGDAHFESAIPQSSNGFYRMVIVKDGAQLFTSLYYPSVADRKEITVNTDKGIIFVDDTPDNVALCAYSKYLADNGKRLWQAHDADDATVLSLLKSYVTSADSVAVANSCSAPVSEFLKLSAYTAAYNGLHSAKRNAKRAGREISFSSQDVLGDIGNSFDCEMATVFAELYPIVSENMPKEATLPQKFEYLFAQYSNESVRATVGQSLVDKFLKRHNYEADFDGGLAQLQAVVDKYGVDKKALAEYEKRRATIKGTPFPAGVTLRDVDGNVVDFSTFKGKYVYIDMWASWCGPCRKEIPHLQKLESELQNDNVVFVSISIDKKEAAWKQKLEEHNMHGYQLIDKDNLLGQALNVQGIPFFAIYDKDGRLYMHGAPRPSMGVALKEMLEKLN